ncbi:hypothetical protein SAMN05216319_1453 [Duganella sp. CF402]|uniref:hypothetical protein n=1 Tax=unclassified Duganella TaxID=2636909 RepID=UPI0008BBB347|nr:MULTISPECIES: hypothetical protein [unclassified Duganella]RZT10095.1 hypothetical protein EV582_2173 [Duganella sp. BK701]SEL28662.1 hypothetical protein SAMN05216319_1453 [Duganella sp. CF402]
MAAALTGCAAPKMQLSANTSAALKDQSIVPTERKKPKFVATAPGPAIALMTGADVKISDGNEIVKVYDIEDPAQSISQRLLQELQSARSVRPVAPAVFVDSSDPEKLATSAKGAAKYILDVETTYWSFLYFPADWKHYRIMYTADARLIDAESKKVVAESRCVRIPDATPTSPTYQELLDNQAQVLKNELKIAADACAKSFKAEMFSL